VNSWRIILALGHISLITASNFFVMYPFTFFGLHSTWGAFCYPLLFVLTDLTTRLLGAHAARQVVFISMVPGLVISYLIAALFTDGHFQGVMSLMIPQILPMRIAFASFMAYFVGQMLDITVFQRFRQNSTWWLAPAVSITLASIVDTIIFFSIAFFHCNDPVLSEHWVEIAFVDWTVKLIVNVLGVVPLYGVVLQAVMKKNSHYAPSVS